MGKTVERNEKLEATIRCIERNRVLNAIQDEADDATAAEIERLAIKARLWVRCECGYTLDATDRKCPACRVRHG